MTQVPSFRESAISAKDETSLPIPLSSEEPKVPGPFVSRNQPRRAGIWGRSVRWGWRLAWACLLNWFFLGSVLVLGWTLRVTRYTTVWWLWRTSPARHNGLSFSDTLKRIAEPGCPECFPEWFTQKSNGIKGWRRGLGGLIANIQLGFRGALNVWMLTLPATILWTFAWYAGWQNSFNKGYELAAVGPLTFIVGVLLFLVAAIYLPLAQARQALTGEWRRFHDYAVVWRLIRQSWFANVLLALAIVVFSIPVHLLKTMPAFIGMADYFVEQPPRQQYLWAAGYFLACGLVVVPLFVLIRLAAGVIYGRTIRLSVICGTVSRQDLAAFEYRVLDILGWLDEPVPDRPGYFVRFVQWVGSRTGRVLSAAALVLIWLAFVFQVLATEFLSYHQGGRGWWNQPLIQLPWFDYTPTRLVGEAFKEQEDRGYHKDTMETK